MTQFIVHQLVQYLEHHMMHYKLIVHQSTISWCTITQAILHQLVIVHELMHNSTVL